MEFKNKIRQHQSGSYNLARELVELSREQRLFDLEYKEVYSDVRYDYDDEPRYRYIKIIWNPAAKTTEEYIATHLSTLKSKYTRHAYKKHFTRAVNRKEEHYTTIQEVYAYLDEQKMFYLVDDFEQIPKSVVKRFPEVVKSAFDDVMYVLKHSQFKAYKKQLEAEFEQALEVELDKIIRRIDCSFSEKEIVKFINPMIDKRVWREVNKVNGTIEVNRDGERYFVAADKVKFDRVDLNKTFKIIFYKLTPKQNEFAQELLKLLQQAIDNKQIEVFTFDATGKIIGFNKRHFAGLMEMKESTFKKMLSRINEKYFDTDWYNKPPK